MKSNLTFPLKKLKLIQSGLYTQGYKMINFQTDYIDSAIWDYQSTTNNSSISLFANDFAEEVVISGNKEHLQFLVDDKVLNEEN